MTFGDTTATNLTNTAFVWDRHPAWKPDGSKLAFTRNGSANWGVYAMSSSNGSSQTRITALTGYEFNPAWSPDTYTATFTVTDDKGASDPTPATRTITVTAAPQNQAPNGSITSPASNVTVPAGQSVTFAGSGTDADGTLAG